MKKICKCIVVLVLCLGMSGCGSNTSDRENQTKIRMHGSTSMEKLVNGLTEVIVEEYSDIVIEPQFTGSSAGIEALLAGTADVATSSRNLKKEEKEQGIVENIVAIDGIAMITNVQNTASNVSTEELQAIYQGEITNWQEVGGEDQQIVVIGREAGSGTRGAFEEILGIEDTCQYAQEVNETGAVVAKVLATPGAIGYVSLDVVDENVKTLALNNSIPNIKNIQEGSYMLQRPFVMATKGDISSQSEAIQNMFRFLDSEAGQKLIASVGLVSIK